MNTIEFLGANGIGKSTLYKIVAEQRERDDLWLTPSEALRKVIIKNIKSKNPISRSNLIRLNVFKKHHEVWARTILSTFNRNVHYSTLNNYNKYLNLFIDGVALYKHSEAYFKLKNFKVYCQRIEDLAYFDYFNLKDTVLWDECLFRNNPGVEQLPEFSDLYKEVNNSGFVHKAIIYCSLDIEENIKRLKSRVEETKRNQTVKNNIIIKKGDLNIMDADDMHLFEVCSFAHERYKIFFEVVKNAGIPFLEINMIHNYEESAQKIRNFIRKLDVIG